MKAFFLNTLRRFLNDEYYCRVRFFWKYKKLLNLRHPDTFNAKINWLKLNLRDPILHKLVDKYEVREYVKEKIGADHLIGLIGVYDTVDAIDFAKLPEKFVIKGTHGSGWVIVCEDKKCLDWSMARKKMSDWLHTDFYEKFGEWSYANVPKRLIIEEFMSNPNESALLDYKLYCFNGEPQFFHVDLDRFVKHTRNFYDLNWQRLPFSLCYPNSDRDIEKPIRLAEMIQIGKELSEGFDLVRVDLYEIRGKVFFGEMTFYPGNGLEIFIPHEYDEKIGALLHLSAKNEKKYHA